MPGGWVGRVAELEAIEAALLRLAGGQGGAVCVSGEPGIGKTRLLAEAGRRAEARNCLLLEGQAAELERDFPFSVVIDALEPYLLSVPDARLRSLTDDQRRLLGVLFPVLETEEPDSPTLPPEERFRCYRALRELLGVLARTQPLVLVLDDLHWADPASLELLDHVLRRPPAAPVLLLLAHRTGPPLDPLARVERRIELAPLGREDADALLGDALPAEARRQLYEESGGNPFHLEHLAHAWTRDGEGSLPHAVEEALARELAALGAPTRRVLQGAAVAGDPFTPEQAAEVAGEDPAIALAALDEAISVRLVRPTDTPVLFRFRHPIVHRAVYASAGEAWRVSAHARAATLLGRRGGTPLAMAHHVERSATQGDEEAVALLTAAGQSASMLAPATAARWFAAALRLLPEDADGGRRVALLGPLASALGTAGRLQQSRDTLAEILKELPVAFAAERGRVIAFMTRLDHLLGRRSDGRQMLEHTLAGVADRRSTEAAGLEFALAVDRYFVSDWIAMRAHAERAQNAAQHTGDDALRATVTALLGGVEYGLGRVGAARERRAEALAILDAPLDRASDPSIGTLGALDWLGWLEVKIEEYAAAGEHFARGLEIARSHGGGHLLPSLTFGLFLHSLWTGRLAEAGEHSDASLELARLLRSDRMLSWALGLRGLLELRRGQVSEAVAHGEEARRLGAELTADTFYSVICAWHGEALIEAGRAEEGRDEIVRAFGGPELPDLEVSFRPFFYDPLTSAEVALGRHDAAAGWAQAAEETARDLNLPGRRGAALRAAAMAARDPVEGAALAGRAADQFAVAHPLEAGRARVLAGRRLAEAGDREPALTQLRRGGDELAALGARHYAAQAVRERRRLGEHVAQGGRRRLAVTTGLEALSDREREVASLVEQRLTNREIAQRLVLSEKTIERHMSRIFGKLGVRSRVEVARSMTTPSP
jgi:DNA-binding NarL/FixJ family response regulator